MRLALAALCVVVGTTMAMAQTRDDRKPGDSTGQSVETQQKSQAQPQGPTGPLTTGSGGAAASGPQGGTPPGMQVQPDSETKGVAQPAPGR
jgi:hypothetical protein